MEYITHSFVHGKHMSCSFIENDNTLKVGICIQVLTWLGEECYSYKCHSKVIVWLSPKVPIRQSYKTVTHRTMIGWEQSLPR